MPGLGRSLGEGNGNPLQYSWLENSMHRGAWRATVHGVAKNQIRLSDKPFTSLKRYHSLMSRPNYIIPNLSTPSGYIALFQFRGEGLKKCLSASEYQLLISGNFKNILLLILVPTWLFKRIMQQFTGKSLRVSSALDGSPPSTPLALGFLFMALQSLQSGKTIQRVDQNKISN